MLEKCGITQVHAKKSASVLILIAQMLKIFEQNLEL